jgi:hypothetical protein
MGFSPNRCQNVRKTVWRHSRRFIASKQKYMVWYSRSQCTLDLRQGSAAACLLGMRVRILPEACLSVCCEYCVLSGRGICVGLITHLGESYGVWSVWVKPLKCRPWAGIGSKGHHRKKWYNTGAGMSQSLDWPGYGVDYPGFEFHVGQENDLISKKCSDSLQGPPGVLFNEYWELCPGCKAVGERDWPLTWG